MHIFMFINFSVPFKISLPSQLPEPSTNTPTYTVVDNASQRGKRKQVDIDGYTYTVKVTLNDSLQIKEKYIKFVLKLW
jgi:hypothetical protein